MKSNRIFISYRRDGGDGIAGRIRDALRQRGYDVFLDVEDLRSGKFNEALLAEIDDCTDFIVVLSANSLDRCQNDGDWVRIEIAHALCKKKNIVPVLCRNFQFPENLPLDIAELRLYHGIASSHDLFEASMTRITALLQCRPHRSLMPWASTAIGILVVICATMAWHFRTEPTTGPTEADGAELVPEDTTLVSTVNRSLTQADFEKIADSTVLSILTTLGQKRLLYNTAAPIQIAMGRLTNNTTDRIENDQLIQPILTRLTSSGSIEVRGQNQLLEDYKKLDAFENGEGQSPVAAKFFILDLVLIESRESPSSVYTLVGTLIEIETRTEVWRDTIVLR